MAEHGFVEEAAAIAAAWSRGDREAAERAVSDAMIDASSIAGTAAQCRERLEAYPPLRHRAADPQPVRPRAWRQGKVRGGDPGLRALAGRPMNPRGGRLESDRDRRWNC